MKAKEKAKELVKQYEPLLYQGYGDLDGYNIAKKCALICVDEMYEIVGQIEQDCKYSNFLVDVEQEINKL